MRLLLLAFALLVSACGGEAPDPDPPPAPVDVAASEVPADSTSRLPRLSVGPDGTVLLSWLEDRGDGHALQFATWTGNGWSEPSNAGEDSNWFVNWADTPGVVALEDGRMLAHALPMHPDGESVYAYDVSVWQRGDAWSVPSLLNTDGVPAEHGFVSAVALEDGSAGLVWLDGRNQGGGHGHGGGAMTLRFATLEGDGSRRDETVLDARTCDCCPTALASASSGLVAAYRDRSDDEIRDIAVVRRVGGVWTEPVVPHADGWRIEGCPVNGPALDARGDDVALAWYTEADGEPRVQLSKSADGGATWSEPVRVDVGRPIGRVDVAVLEDGRAAVIWLEDAGSDQAEIHVRSVDDGPLYRTTVATVESGRASGIPQIAALGDRAMVAWTETRGVQTTLVTL